MNDLIMFENEEFGQIRGTLVDGIPYLVGKDITEKLGYQNSSKALADHVDDEDKLNNKSLLSLGQRGGWLINESGLFSLILSSKLPNAKKFKRWVTSEVLPSIRKHGAYMTEEAIEKAITDPDFLIQLATKIKEEKEARIKAEEKVKEKQLEIKHKEEVITGLTANITTAEKRQLISRVVKYNTYEYQKRWAELYKQFEMKYHCDLERRMKKYNKSNSPKMKSKIDYIDRVMNMIPEFYELACKLYENDINSIIKELYYITSK